MVMRIELGFLAEGQRTDRAPQFRTIVGRLVGVQRSILCERLATLQTDERLDLVVDEAVVLQMILTSKRFATARLLTGERTFVGVNAFVDQQVVRFAEFSVAKSAQVLALCSLQFHYGH